MVSSDNYHQCLSEIIQSVEKIYGIQELVQHGSDISTVLKAVNAEVMSIEKSKVASRNLEVGKQIVLLAYICFRLEFFHTSRLDFRQFLMLEEIDRVLELFVCRENYTSKNMRSVNRVIKLMAKMDESSAAIRLGLAYRYLRCFIIMIIYNSACNASIVANLLLQQLRIQNSIEGRVRE